MSTFIGQLIGFAVIPFGPDQTIDVFGMTVKPFVISDINIGILYMVSISSLVVVGIIMAGWSSNNKYSVLGAMRSAAQAVSYEVPLVLSLLGPVMIAGTIVATRTAPGGMWKRGFTRESGSANGIIPSRANE